MSFMAQAQRVQKRHAKNREPYGFLSLTYINNSLTRERQANFPPPEPILQNRVLS